MQRANGSELGNVCCRSIHVASVIGVPFPSCHLSSPNKAPLGVSRVMFFVYPPQSGKKLKNKGVPILTARFLLVKRRKKQVARTVSKGSPFARRCRCVAIFILESRLKTATAPVRVQMDTRAQSVLRGFSRHLWRLRNRCCRIARQGDFAKRERRLRSARVDEQIVATRIG